MTLKPDDLPSDLVSALAALQTEREARLQAEAVAASVQAQLSDNEALIAHLELRIEKLKRELYGQRSERTARLIEQLELELEELVTTASEDELAAQAAAAKTQNVRPFMRKRPVRKPWPDDIERERVVIEAPTTCACCGGSRLAKIGEDVTSALLVADMPFLSFHLSVSETIQNAGGFLQRGAAAVKLEGGAKRIDMVRALVDCEIPVMGHLGLTPQSVNVMGGFKVQGRKADEALRLLDDARRLQEAGCFALVLEGIPAELAARATESLRIPTIGIGAGPGCSGQVLVFHDVLGLTQGQRPKFVRTYAEGFRLLQDALSRWATDVRSGAFPGPQESYRLPDGLGDAIASWTPSNPT